MDDRSLSSYSPKDLLYIVDVNQEGESLPEDKVRVLFSDARGTLTTYVIDKTTLDTAKTAVLQLGSEGKGGAAVCLEVSPGVSTTFAVEISDQEANALSSILQAALNTNSVPPDLVPHIENIITRGLSSIISKVPNYTLNTGSLEMNTNPNNIVAFGMQEITVKDEGEVSLTCVDYNSKVCFVVVPKHAWQQVDGQGTELCHELGMGATIAIEGIFTPNPWIVPAFFPVDMLSTYQNIEMAIGELCQIPTSIEGDVRSLLSSTFYIEKQNDNTPTGVELRRVGKNLKNGEMYTRNRSGQRLAVFHTCLSSEPPKPYSFIQMTKLKLRGLKFW